MRHIKGVKNNVIIILRFPKVCFIFVLFHYYNLYPFLFIDDYAFRNSVSMLFFSIIFMRFSKAKLQMSLSILKKRKIQLESVILQNLLKWFSHGPNECRSEYTVVMAVGHGQGSCMKIWLLPEKALEPLLWRMISS